MSNLRELFWLSAQFNFSVKAIHIPGIINILPDAISRLHEPKQWFRMSDEFYKLGYYLFPNNFRFHMSKKAIYSLLFQILNWLGWKVN